ncbi:156_t:CDS:2 [Paraglomus brasilianum]|uniref:156_t:CDS:1 n=1 Tax=Paraglomus brasilianum TaxID=144538 RepID=A0A9N9DAK4_9GLOM|nr:156_t:CDS:2 [Paraglomus brasilianum]
MFIRLNLDFYRDSIIDDWTCLNLVDFYRAELKQKDLKQVLDRIKKDLAEVANPELGFDVTRRKRAQQILDNWKTSKVLSVKSWAMSVKNVKKDCARVKVKHLQVIVKQINQLSTGGVAIYNDNHHTILGKRRQEADDENNMNIEGAAGSEKRTRVAVSDYCKLKTTDEEVDLFETISQENEREATDTDKNFPQENEEKATAMRQVSDLNEEQELIWSNERSFMFVRVVS